MLVVNPGRYDMRSFVGLDRATSRWGLGTKGRGGPNKRFAAAIDAAAAMAERLEPRVLLALVEWDGGAGTDSWHDALNWSGDAVPTAVDDVVIGESEVIVRVTGGASVRTLTTQVDVRVHGSLNVVESLDLHARLTLGNGTNPGYIRFETGHDGTIGGDGDVFLDYVGNGQGSSISLASATLRIAEGVLVHGGGGQIYVGNGHLVIDGEVRADQADRSILLYATANGATVTVNGLLQSTAGILQLGGDSILVEQGSALQSVGGRFELWGIVENTGRTFTIPAASGDLYLRGGGFRGGTVRSAGGAGLRVDGALGYSLVAGLIGVHLEALMWVYNGGELRIRENLVLDGSITLGDGGYGFGGTIAGYGKLVFSSDSPVQTISGSGQVVFDHSATYPGLASAALIVNSGASLTVGDGITFRGGGGDIRVIDGGTLFFDGSVDADAPDRFIALVSAASTSVLVCRGRMEGSAGTVILMGLATNATVTLAGSCSLTSSGGAVQVIGRLDNTNHTLLVSGEIYLSGTLIGGVIAAADTNASLGFSPSFRHPPIATLRGTTVNVPIQLPIQSLLYIEEGLSLNATITIGTNSSPNQGGTLIFRNTPQQLLSGSGSILFGGMSATDTIRIDSVQLTIESSISIRGGKGRILISAGSITNFGNIEATAVGGTISLSGSHVHHGVMRIAAGARVQRTGAWTFQPESRLEVEIGGTASAQFGQFTATGAVVAEGSVEVRYINGYEPPRGSSIRFVSSIGASGAFSSITTPPLSDPDLKSPVLIDAQGVRLIITHIADFNNDLTVNEADIFAFLNDWFAGGGDFDGNGERTVTDIFVFLSAWYRA